MPCSGTRTTILLLAIAVAFTTPCRADRFNIVDETGEKREVEARLAGSGQDVFALEFDDGRIELIPQRNVRNRVPNDGPKPLSPKEMEEKLKREYDAKTFRSLVQSPFVIGLVLSEPLKDRTEEVRAKAFLQRVGRFMKRIETVFSTFSKSVKFPNRDPRYPLVVMIFETDDDFEKYSVKITGNRTISASRIAGFYNGLTNWLAIRLSECNSFEVPLHEAIHQQVYNTGVTKRLSPAPKWFQEGIATGFEGDGDRVSVGPNRINKNYAKRAQQPRTIDWKTVVATDRVFRGNVLVGDAYTHAWSMHWLLVTQHKEQYIEFVKKLSTLEPLQRIDNEDRTKQFVEAFGKSPDELQKQFLPTLQKSLRAQRIVFKDEKTVGVSRDEKNLAAYEIFAVERNGVLHVNGKLRNISPLRAMTYHVTVETNGGTYADWLVPSLRSRQIVTLKSQAAQKLMRNARGGSSSTFRVRIRAVTPSSAEAGRWNKGQLPVPVYGG